MLKLPVPEAVRDRRVDATVDNMLKITNDGRKLALDQRLINDMLPDEDNSKATTCVDKAFKIWEETKEQKSAQLILSDWSACRRTACKVECSGCLGQIKWMIKAIMNV